MSPIGCASSDRLARLQQENADLRAGLSARDGQIDGLKADLQALADKDATARRVLELRQSLDAETAQHAEVAKRLEESSRERQRLSTDLDGARENNAKLAEENRQLKELTADVNNPLVRVAVIEWKLVQRLHGAALIAQNDDRTYLGLIDFAGTHFDSIFNDVGLHGSEVGLESIWNDVGFYGSEVGLYSARNEVCINPPMLVKDRKILGYVTANRVYPGTPRFDPYYLRDLARRLQGKLGGQ